MRCLGFIAGIFMQLVAGAQDLSGKWEGQFYANLLTVPTQRLSIDLQVSAEGFVTGSSHLYYGNNQYEHYLISGRYNFADSTIFISEDSIIAVNLNNEHCTGNYALKLKIRRDIMRLEGNWIDNSSKSPACGSAKVYLEMSLPPEVPQTKKKDKNLDRIPEIQKRIEVRHEETDSVKVELVDNAQVDGDVVSVYLDDSLVISKKKISATPLVFYLGFSKAKERFQIKMAAESMGAVPPCTALMIITTRKNRYELTLSSDFGNNGVLEISGRE
jgi:hypothetical protein